MSGNLGDIQLKAPYRAGSGRIFTNDLTTILVTAGFVPSRVTLYSKTNLGINTTYAVSVVGPATLALGAVITGTDRNYSTGDLASLAVSIADGVAGSGTVTSVATGTGLTGGPVTGTGTIAIATSTIDTLAGFSHTGVFGSVTVSTGLSLSGGVLTATGGGGGSGGLTPTATKTTAYNAVVGDFVICDSTSGAVAVTLPAAPANGSQIAVRGVNLTGSPVSVVCSGSDKFDRSSGGTTLTLDYAEQTVWLQYRTTGALWFFLTDSEPVAQWQAYLAATYCSLTKTTGWTIKQHVSTITTVTVSGTTFTCDLSLSDWFQLTPTVSFTVALSNATVGQQFTLRIVQGGSGSCVPTWFTTIKWAGGSPPTLTTAVGGIDVLTFKCVATNTYDGFVAGQGLA
jgi:hypothetical protein